MNKLSKITAAFAALVVVLLAPGATYAHGFGERYDLPVPLNLYIAGAGAPVLFSFVVIALFARGERRGSYPRLDLLRWRAGRALAHPWVLHVPKAASAFVFLLFLAAALFGNQDANRNLAPTLTWIMFWVGLAYFTAFVGNIWALINPWKVLFAWAEAGYRRATGRSLSRNQPYPEGLGAWPAVALFLVFAWVENVFPGSSVPFNLGVLALAYSLITFAGMFWYGRGVWLRNGEAFSLAFGFLAAFSPTEVRVRKQAAASPAGGPRLRASGRLVGGQIVVTQSADQPRQVDLVDDYEAYANALPDEREWNVRPWGAGLLSVRTPTTSHMVFLVLMLATVTFDGFAETPLWANIWTAGYNALQGVFGFQASVVVGTVGVAVFPVLFLAAFAVTAQLMGLLARSEMGTVEMMTAFVYSLVPIALAYHVAHFFSFLFIQGQRIIPLASDPMGYGWDLFGTAGYVINIAVVNARFAWLVSVAAIVIGHIVAVYAAHVYAMRLFSRALALRSQYPMMALMVAYTMVSLWIVAQPIVEVG